MSKTTDKANVIMPPPLAWAFAFVTGLALDWAYPLPIDLPEHRWIGGGLLGAGIILAIWAVVMFRRAGTHVEPYKPTTAIVATGPYRYSRNPIYLGMFLGQSGLGVAFDSAWIIATLLPFYLVIRYGVVAREEAYLRRKFGDGYRQYTSRVRRWL